MVKKFTTPFLMAIPGFKVSKIWRLLGTSTSFSNRISASDEMR